MPISTVPNTPPRRDEPAAAPVFVQDARMRWGAPPKPPGAGSPPYCLGVIVICVVLAWLYASHTPHVAKRPAIVAFEPAPDKQSVVVVITATSPQALAALCGVGTHVQVASALSVRDHPRVCSPRVDWSSLSPLQSRLEVIVGVMPGLDAAFDAQFPSWAREMQYMQAEEWIDESCRERKEVPCSVKEIGLLRAAMLWAHLGEEALAMSRRGFVVKITPVPASGVALEHRLSHRALLEQIAGVQGQVSTQLGLAKSMYLSGARAKPLEEPLDAGSCFVVNGRAAYARCLPSFIIIGAQKAGTDELSVWLNFNAYHRRMDGGIETHFFDCVGRGKGKGREPCRRGRSFAMTAKTVTGAAPPPANDSSSSRWSWEHFAAKSPFVDDGLYEVYLRLGQLDRPSYYRQPSRTMLYEKTPSYLDLADPRDVARLMPSLKLVLLTKDPVPRLFSSYWQSCDSVPKNEPQCSTTEFEQLAWRVTRPDFSMQAAEDPYGRLETMHRALIHGMYARLLEQWIYAFRASRSQILVVDAHHMHFIPQAVVYAVECHVGNRGKRRHHVYKPHWKDGYWVLGDYSKANHPSHPSNRAMDANTTAMLAEFYRPHAKAYRALLEKYPDAIAQGCVGDNIPAEYRQPHPTLFTGKGHNSFVLPPWAVL